MAVLETIRGRKRDWRTPVTLTVGVIVVGAALALPAPRQAAAPPSVAAGPTRLGDAWPGAEVVTIAATLRDGTAFRPLLAIDTTTVVGVADSPDLTTSRLVVRSGDGALRTLRTLQGQQGSSVAAVSVTGNQLYWLEITDDAEGNRLISLWNAATAGGLAKLLATDSGDLLYYDSAYDLQLTGGNAVWAAAGAQGGGEIHSVPVSGGTMTVRQLDRLYALSAWPWVTSSAGSKPGDVVLLNLSTGETRKIPAGPSEILTCTPVWCRVTTLINQGQSITFEAERADGTDRQKIGNGSKTPVNTDVALLDRFEILSATASTTAAGYTQQLWLRDLPAGKEVLLADAATATIASRGAFLWWSTGDNETVTWHLLDLRTLT